MKNKENLKQNNRIQFLEILRVIACFSVLLFHVINGYNKDSLTKPQLYVPQFWNIVLIILPLYQVSTFFSISGFLFQKFNSESFEKLRKGFFFKDYGKLAVKKLVCLGIPYLFFSVLYIVLSIPLQSDMHTAYGLSSIFKIFIEPVAQYWYLHSLIIIFLIAPFILLVTRGNALIGFIISIVLYLSTLVINYPLQSPIEHLSTFFLGCLLAYSGKYWEKLAQKFIPVFWVAVFFLISNIYVFFKLDSQWNDIVSAIVELTAKIVLILVLFCFGVSLEKNKGIGSWAVFLSKHTLHIYLIHTWITGVVRVALLHFNVFNVIIHVLAGTVLGSLISFAAAFIIRKIKIFDFVFEPGKYINFKPRKQTKG